MRKRIEWQSYAVHNDKEIKGFFGEGENGYRFLSNFHIFEEPVIFEAMNFFATENAYMAAKTYDVNDRYRLVGMSPAEARKFGQTIKLRPDWELVKEDFMFLFNYQKYERNLDLRRKLLETGNKYLEETNSWGDVFWGVDINKGGQNKLGKILMRVRQMFKIH